MKTMDEWREYRNGARQYAPDGPIYLPSWDWETGEMPDVKNLPEVQDVPAEIIPFPPRVEDQEPLTRSESRPYWD